MRAWRLGAKIFVKVVLLNILSVRAYNHSCSALIMVKVESRRASNSSVHLDRDDFRNPRIRHGDSVQ
ncbi:MAG: hypothetical protein ACE1ZE_02200, partial [Candidatus Binatia bacterium]